MPTPPYRLDMRGQYRPLPDPFTATSRFVWMGQPAYVNPSWYPGSSTVAKTGEPFQRSAQPRDAPSPIIAQPYRDNHVRLDRPHSIAALCQIFK
jgi:hypothetical protein